MLSTPLIITGATFLLGCMVTPSPENPNVGPDTRITCRETAYEGYTYRGATAIPDDDPAGTRIGPIHVAGDGHRLGELMVGVDISHGYVGDVEIQLLYDADGDGEADARAPLEIYQARTDACDGNVLNAYPVILEGRYFFRDGLDTESAHGASRLRTFTNLPRGGDFYLAVSDKGAGHAGTVRGWIVFLDSDAGNALIGTLRL